MATVLEKLERASRGSILLLGFLLSGILGLVDYWTGWEISFSIFYLLPILFVTSYAGRSPGLIVSFACAITWLIADRMLGTLYSKPIIPYWNAFMRLGFFAVVVYYASSWRMLVQTLGRQVHERTASLTTEIAERKRVEDEFRTVLSDIKTLSGLLPICSSCKRIREDDGSWHQLEAYIIGHSEAQFTHGLCPDCLERVYPEFSGKKREG